MDRSKYILTATAERNFYEAKMWSMKRWGRDLTRQYFKDIHRSANELADHHFSATEFTETVSDAEVLVWPVREHYLVYVPIRKGLIIIVALIRQTRDVLSIVAANSFILRRELKAAHQSIEKIRNK